MLTPDLISPDSRGPASPRRRFAGLGGALAWLALWTPLFLITLRGQLLSGFHMDDWALTWETARWIEGKRPFWSISFITTWHVAFIWTWGILYQLFGLNPAAFTLFHSLADPAIFVYFLQLARRLGAPIWGVLFLFFSYFSVPFNSSWNINLQIYSWPVLFGLMFATHVMAAIDPGPRRRAVSHGCVALAALLLGLLHHIFILGMAAWTLAYLLREELSERPGRAITSENPEQANLARRIRLAVIAVPTVALVGAACFVVMKGHLWLDRPPYAELKVTWDTFAENMESALTREIAGPALLFMIIMGAASSFPPAAVAMAVAALAPIPIAWKALIIFPGVALFSGSSSLRAAAGLVFWHLLMLAIVSEHQERGYQWGQVTFYLLAAFWACVVWLAGALGALLKSSFAGNMNGIHSPLALARLSWGSLSRGSWRDKIFVAAGALGLGATMISLAIPEALRRERMYQTYGAHTNQPPRLVDWVLTTHGDLAAAPLYFNPIEGAIAERRFDRNSVLAFEFARALKTGNYIQARSQVGTERIRPPALYLSGENPDALRRNLARRYEFAMRTEPGPFYPLTLAIIRGVRPGGELGFERVFGPDDPEIQGGRALPEGKYPQWRALFSDGHIQYPIQLPKGRFIVEIHARGSTFNNIGAQYDVLVGGRSLGRFTANPDSPPRALEFENSNPMRVTLTIRFLNDESGIDPATGKPGDRNLRVGRVTVREIQGAPAPAPKDEP